MNKYKFFGDTVESDIPLPELQPAGEVRGRCLRVTAGAPAVSYVEKVHEWENDGELEMTCFRNGNWFRLDLHEQLVTHLDTSRDEVFYEAIGADESTIRHFLLDQALPRLKGQLGALVLHGGAVSSGAGTIAFLGEGGAGKSTLCASFNMHGWGVLSDDCLVVDPQSRSIHGSYPGIRLWPGSIEGLGLTGGVTRPMAGYSDKQRMCVDIGEAITDPRELNLVVVLKPVVKPGDSPVLAPLSGPDATMALVESSFNLDPSDGLRATTRIQQIAGLLETGVVVESCTVPTDFGQLNAIRALLIDRLVSLQ